MRLSQPGGGSESDPRPVSLALKREIEMDTKHTPGPWTRRKFPYVTHQEIITVDGHAPICFVYMPENAILIAAAPTMYSFVASKAQSGDNEARKILESIHGNAKGN